MNSTRGMKLVSTLGFTGAAGTGFRYEIYEDLDNPGQFGLQIYVLALVEGLKKESVMDVSRPGAPQTLNVKTWVFAQGAYLEGISDINAAEIAAQQHFAQNHMFIRQSMSPLV